jgi:hypothetical protein
MLVSKPGLLDVVAEVNARACRLRVCAFYSHAAADKLTTFRSAVARRLPRGKLLALTLNL